MADDTTTNPTSNPTSTQATQASTSDSSTKDHNAIQQVSQSLTNLINQLITNHKSGKNEILNDVEACAQAVAENISKANDLIDAGKNYTVDLGMGFLTAALNVYKAQSNKS